MSQGITDLASSVQSAWYMRSVSLCVKLKLYSTISHISTPLLRYIESSYLSLPVKTVVLIERPYANDILPAVASAMSYDITKALQPTPSTAVLATDIKNGTQEEWASVEEWFRDSWKYIKSGVFLINVCCFEPFMGNSLRERTAVCEFIRDMVEVSYTMSGITVDLVALGNPATACADKIRTNIPDRKRKLKVVSGPNPAGLKHKFGDLTSPSLTLGKVGITKALHLAILRSKKFPTTTLEEYLSMSSNSGTFANDGKNLIADLERVEKFFKDGGKYQGPMSDEEVFRALRTSVSKFVDTCTRESVTAALSDWRETGGAAKGAYKSSNRSYTQKNYNRGTSSEKSIPSSTKPFNATPSKAKFAEDDDEPETTNNSTPAINTPSTSVVDNNTLEDSYQTPTKAPITPKAPASTYSSRSTPVGVKSLFMEDIPEDDDVTDAAVLNDPALNDIVTTSTNVSDQPSSPTLLSKEEYNTLELVSDLLNTSPQYNVSPQILEEISEFSRNKRPSSASARELLAAIRESVCDSNWNATQDLGFVDNHMNVENPIVQLIIKWSS